MRKRLGRYIVVDSGICHGQPTFRGTRVLVKRPNDQVRKECRGKLLESNGAGAVPNAAIAEAVRLAGQALVDHLPQSKGEPVRT